MLDQFTQLTNMYAVHAFCITLPLYIISALLIGDAGDTRNLQNLVQEKEQQIMTLNQQLERKNEELEAEVDKLEKLRQSQEAVRRYQQQGLINKDEVTSLIQEWKNIAGEVIPSVHYYISNDEIIHFILCRRD